MKMMICPPLLMLFAYLFVGEFACALPQPPAACVPFDPTPEGHATLQSWCRAQFRRPRGVFDDLFANAPSANPSVGFSLKGCVVGCLAGRNSANVIVGNPAAGGSWTGKCLTYWDSQGLPNGTDNIVTPLAPLWDWRKGLGGVASFFADMYVAPSLSDGRPAWKVDYTETQPLWQAFQNTTFDELREVRPGYVISKGYVQFRPIKAGPQQYTVFALLQVCDPSGNYPATPKDRVVP